MSDYFSDREGRTPPRPTEQIRDEVWAGVRALIAASVDKNCFAESYPDTCPDYSTMVAGTNEVALRDAMRAEIPGLPTWPWLAGSSSPEAPPTTPTILDLVEFCSRKIAAPRVLGHHKFHHHDHLRFDARQGQMDFRDDVNRILRRNGVAYRLNAEHQIQRLTEPVFRQVLENMSFSTGDEDLDHMLLTAQTKFLHRDAEVRPEALQSLWDAWERLKTLPDGLGKKEQATAMLKEAAGLSAPKYLHLLQQEAMELTRIGNTMQIRHSETDQERLARDEHRDYLFLRMWSFLSMILHSTGRVATQAAALRPDRRNPPTKSTDPGAFQKWDDDIPF